MASSKNYLPQIQDIRLPEEWVPTIPKYNAPLPYGLEYEYEYILKNDGKFYKKGAKYFETFEVNTTPDHFQSLGSVIEKDAKEKALERIHEIFQQEYVYWWGANHKDPNKVTEVVIKYRHLHLFSRHEDQALFSKWEKAYRILPPGHVYPNGVRKFAKEKKEEFKNERSLLNEFVQFVGKYISLDLKWK